MRIFVLLLWVILWANDFYGQRILMAENVGADTMEIEFGPNRKNFFHSVINLGLIIPDKEAIDIQAGSSYALGIGYRYKRRVNQVYGLGFDFGYAFRNHKIKQKEGKLFPDSLVHNKEKFTNHAMMLGLFNRFNFGRRGDVIGKYVDVFVYGEWLFNAAHLYTDKHDIPVNGAKITSVINRKLNYTTDFNYGCGARLAINRIGIYGQYRLSEIFTPSSGLAEMPALTVGVDITIPSQN